ncbi:hypothetical protein [Paraflavitalea speifideaquila]|uniref:hypothetical protein n=1 Tax=Paraflavitalea speifideaquila TaxID=3076558 RepID=UPI0028F00CF8|nr:hypothetical protein [Paraflavitalea speifideiaquila]
MLFSILFSLLVPYLSFQVTQHTPDVLENIYLPAIIPITQEQAPEVTNPPVEAARTIPFSLIALIIYVLVTFILLVRFIRNLYRIRQAITGNKVLHYHEAWLILVNKDIPAHSFLQYVFMSSADYNDPHTRNALLTHELSHVRQKHSWDILFLELLQVFYWFNPIYFFYKKLFN